jgi:hypothetical protein
MVSDIYEKRKQKMRMMEERRMCTGIGKRREGEN